MKILNLNIYDYLFALLLIIIPFSFAIPNVLLAALTVLFLLRIKKAGFGSLAQPHFILVAILITYLILKAAFTNTLVDEFKVYSKLLLVLLIPILFLHIRKLNTVLYAIVLSSVATIAVASFNIAIHYIEEGSLNLFEGGFINNLLGVERPYLGFLTVVGIISAIKLAWTDRKYALLLYIYALVSSAFIVFIAARIAFITILLLLVVYIFGYSTLKLRYKLYLFTAFIALTTAVCLINKSFLDRFYVKNSLDATIAQAALYEPRLIIWDCAIEAASDTSFNHVFGYSSSTTVQQHLTSCYPTRITNDSGRAQFFVDTNYNTHNQFLGLYLIGGIIALCIIAGLYFYLTIFCYKDFIAIAYVIALLLFFIVENVLERQLGAYYFIIVVSILHRVRLQNHAQTELA